MQVDDATLEAMCKAHQNNPGPTPSHDWDAIGPGYQEAARADMRAALAVLPEPPLAEFDELRAKLEAEHRALFALREACLWGDFGGAYLPRKFCVESLRRGSYHHAASYIERIGRVLTSIAPEQPASTDEQPDWHAVGDGAFARPFGTVRVCIDCGALVAGGPTRCGRCARDAAKAGGL